MQTDVGHTKLLNNGSNLYASGCSMALRLQLDTALCGTRSVGYAPMACFKLRP